MSPTKIFATIMLFQGVLSMSSQAATIESSSYEGCALNLSGVIERGDYEKVLNAATAASMIGNTDYAETMNRPDQALCLDSPGGAFLEGRNIARLVHENGIGTRILADAECYSACAYIFMAGHMLGYEFDGPYRYLNVQGKLGFHAPYFQLPKDENFTGEDVSSFVRAQSDMIADFIDFANYTSAFDYGPTISMSLVGEMLWAGSGELAFVDTTEKAARWGVSLEGVEPMRIDDAAAAVACQNFEAWISDQPSEISDYIEVSDHRTINLYGTPTTFGYVDTGGYAERNCLVELHSEPTAGFSVCTANGFNGMSLGTCPREAEGYAIWVPAFYSLPPDTPLASLN